MEKSFVCSYCKRKVEINMRMGVSHRNHCPFCLWSKHVDKDKAGDRDEPCQGMMEPVGLTFKKVKPDKFGKERKGELMLVHQCQKCQKISLNRVASDDDPNKIIKLSSEENKEEAKKQLIGKR